MKKTLIALMALASVAVAADTDVTYTIQNSITKRNSKFNAKGFIWDLDAVGNTALTLTSSPAGESLSPYIELESVTLTTGGTQGDAVGAFSIVITDTAFNIVGWSTTVSTADKTNTWNFVAGENKPVVLDSSKEYLFLADTATSFTLGAKLNAVITEMRLGTDGVTEYGDNKLDFDSSDSGLYNGFQFIKVTSADGQYTGYETSNVLNGTDVFAKFAPTITIVAKSIPEPTTATLSLLALAGLAARRRRK